MSDYGSAHYSMSELQADAAKALAIYAGGGIPDQPRGFERYNPRELPRKYRV